MEEGKVKPFAIPVSQQEYFIRKYFAVAEVTASTAYHTG